MKTFIQFLTEQVEPLYVSRPLQNAPEFIQWAKQAGFTTTLAPDDLHVTIVYSKAAIEWNDFQEKSNTITVTTGERSIKVFGKGAAVLVFECKELRDRHNEFIDAGASFDYPEYHSHVTISYEVPEGLDVSQIKPYAGKLVFGAEHFESVNTEKEFKEA